MDNLKDLEIPSENPEGAANSSHLFEILEDLISQTEEQPLYEKVVDYGIELTGGLRGFLLLKKEGNEGMPKFEVKASRYFETSPEKEFPISNTFLRKVFQAGKPMLTTDALSDKDLKQAESVLKFSLKSIVCVPLKIKNKNLGVLYIDHPEEEGFFDESQMKALEILGRFAAIVLDKAASVRHQREKEAVLNSHLDAINSKQALFIPFDERLTWDDYEGQFLTQLVSLYGGKKSKAAQKLDLSRTTLNKKLRMTAAG